MASDTNVSIQPDVNIKNVVNPSEFLIGDTEAVEISTSEVQPTIVSDPGLILQGTIKPTTVPIKVTNTATISFEPPKVGQNVITQPAMQLKLPNIPSAPGTYVIRLVPRPETATMSKESLPKTINLVTPELSSTRPAAPFQVLPSQVTTPRTQQSATVLGQENILMGNSMITKYTIVSKPQQTETKSKVITSQVTTQTTFPAESGEPQPQKNVQITDLSKLIMNTGSGMSQMPTLMPVQLQGGGTIFVPIGKLSGSGPGGIKLVPMSLAGDKTKFIPLSSLQKAATGVIPEGVNIKVIKAEKKDIELVNEDQIASEFISETKVEPDIRAEEEVQEEEVPQQQEEVETEETDQKPGTSSDQPGSASYAKVPKPVASLGLAAMAEYCAMIVENDEDKKKPSKEVKRLDDGDSDANFLQMIEAMLEAGLKDMPDDCGDGTSITEEVRQNLMRRVLENAGVGGVNELSGEDLQYVINQVRKKQAEMELISNSRSAKKIHGSLTTGKAKPSCKGVEVINLFHQHHRELMPAWLDRQVRSGDISGLKWLDEAKLTLQIPWCHKSSNNWTDGDALLFKRWAMHTGKYNPYRPNPKRWKANFRCAMNCYFYRVHDRTPGRRIFRFREAYHAAVQQNGETRNGYWKWRRRLGRVVGERAEYIGVDNPPADPTFGIMELNVTQNTSTVIEEPAPIDINSSISNDERHPAAIVEETVTTSQSHDRVPCVVNNEDGQVIIVDIKPIKKRKYFVSRDVLGSAKKWTEEGIDPKRAKVEEWLKGNLPVTMLEIDNTSDMIDHEKAGHEGVIIDSEGEPELEKGSNDESDSDKDSDDDDEPVNKDSDSDSDASSENKPRSRRAEVFKGENDTDRQKKSKKKRLVISKKRAQRSESENESDEEEVKVKVTKKKSVKVKVVQKKKKVPKKVAKASPKKSVKKVKDLTCASCEKIRAKALLTKSSRNIRWKCKDCNTVLQMDDLKKEPGKGSLNRAFALIFKGKK